MSKKQPLSVYSGFFWILLIGMPTGLFAGPTHISSPLEFQHGERVVFLGGSLFENELANAYIEFSLASRFPDREITFRNLGWTGDNIFAEARSTFSTPPTAYQQLFQQIRAAKPDYVMIAYGGIESQQGEEGLEDFTRGLERIIDSIDVLGAQTILFSTLPVKMAGSEENTQLQNRNLRLYADAISKIASRRTKRFVDLFNPLSGNKENLYLDNGIHLSDNGYYFLAQTLEKAFGWPSREEKIVLTVGKQSTSDQLSKKWVADPNGKIRFNVEEKLLPLPLPSSGKSDPSGSISVQVLGLKKGVYTLSENGYQLHTASAAEWAKGITLNHGASFTQSQRIRDYIVSKNDLFFQQYRPLNRTYILGFRAYEQGRHKQGLQDLDFIITWLEGQINLLRKPVTKTYEISPIQLK